MGFADGIDIIKSVAINLPESPGVYRMLGAGDDVLYVGKAKALKRRVISYTQPERLTLRLKRMVSETVRMEIIHTHTEVEALLLEANLIKKLRPRYNILLKDDKSFPYIHITAGHDYPRIEKYRGSQKEGGDYFGPFASVVSVNDTIATLQKAFQLRNCSDSVFASRTRPCLQYHIKRCTAPCVGYVKPEDYEAQVREVREFLAGDSRRIVDRFSSAMQAASDRRDYEEAAKYRDRVRALAHIQLKQDVNVQGLGDADVFALARDKTGVCVQVFFFRAGQNFGNKPYFPRVSEDDSDEDVLAAFLPQFYGSRPPPKTILLSHDVREAALIETGLAEMHKLKHAVSVLAPQRGDKRRVIDFVMKNAEAALVRHAIERAGDAAGLARVAEIFGLDELPQRIEVYDNSHVQGTNKVGGMVVAGPEGFRKNAYRKFNMKGVENGDDYAVLGGQAPAHSARSPLARISSRDRSRGPGETVNKGDDYAMMREVMTRRFTRALEEGHQGDPDKWPDLLLIDGGIGQLNAVLEILDGLGIADDIEVVAISKGPDRNAGREWFHRRGHEPFQLPIDDVGLMYMQRLRDEVHRFAIGTHRAKRGRAMVASALDDIPGIGPTRKKALLQHFGSGKAVERAGMADLLAVPGISQAVAQIVYDHFHGS